MGMHFGGSHGFMMDNNATGLGFEDAFNAIGDSKFAGYQMAKLSEGLKGQNDIMYGNLGYYAGGQQTAMDLIDGKKKIEYDLDEGQGAMGHAGEDNMTIHLAKQAMLTGKERGFEQSAAMYASTFVREGYLIDQWSDFENQTGMKSGETSQKMKDYMELKATKYQLGSLGALEEMGFSVKGNEKYEAVQAGLVYSALTGKAGMFDWSDGNNLKLNYAGEDGGRSFYNNELVNLLTKVRPCVWTDLGAS
ncbi:MAG: hypothetical protein HPY53_11820 [Brevinematales bacterium]|nr:hypothetical protein [Brevinematales bacterium]